jgi:hypothetical protein
MLHPEGGVLESLRRGFSTFFIALAEGASAMAKGELLAGFTPECLRDHAPLAYAVRTWNALPFP